MHIKPLHWYVASDSSLREAFTRTTLLLILRFPSSDEAVEISAYEPQCATGGEATVLGGLKTKNVDIVALKPGLGPVLAISCKGMTGPSHLTNRMEETIGECTNLHITYPALALGYLFAFVRIAGIERSFPLWVRKAHDQCVSLAQNDIALPRGRSAGRINPQFHSALKELTGRKGIRNDVSRV